MLVRVVTDRCDNSLYTVNDHFTRLALIHFSEAAPTSRHGLVAPWTDVPAGRRAELPQRSVQWRAESHACAAITYDPRTSGGGAVGIRYTMIG